MDCLPNYYAILGVSPAADDAELRSAYRTLARRFHPDVNGSVGALALFKDINTAYEVLSNRSQRTQYDHAMQRAMGEMPSLRAQVFYSRRVVRQFNGPQLLYIYIKIKPQLEFDLSTNAPLNVALVVDRSKSMQGTRLQHVKTAARRIIDSCTDQDIVSIITFSDRAEVVVPATRVTDPNQIHAMISTIRADGATSMLSGLQLALAQVERNRDSKYVNHIILITDGRTYGDEEDCLALAGRAHSLGIGISGMGIGEDWNDQFLDAMVSATGGSSAYISKPEMVDRFLQDRIRSLATAYAERAHVIVAPAVGVQIDDLMRVSPDPLKLSTDVQPIPLGTIDGLAVTSLMLQCRINTGSAELGELYLGRIDISGDVLGAQRRCERVVQDISVEVSLREVDEEPPPELVDALSRITLHRLQDRARTAFEQGDYREATRQLEYLATRLFESGEEHLGRAALEESQRISRTAVLSESGAKELKYGTRALLTMSGDGDD